MPEKTMDELRAVYVDQAIAQFMGHGDGAREFVGMLFDEWGAKAYAQGWNHAFDRVRKTLDEYKR